MPTSRPSSMTSKAPIRRSAIVSMAEYTDASDGIDQISEPFLEMMAEMQSWIFILPPAKFSDRRVVDEWLPRKRGDSPDPQGIRHQPSLTCGEVYCQAARRARQNLYERRQHKM